MEINSIDLEGYVYEVKNINLKENGVSQVGTFLFPEGQHQIAIYLSSKVTVALVEGEHLIVHGQFCGDCIVVQRAEIIK